MEISCITSVFTCSMTAPYPQNNKVDSYYLRSAVCGRGWVGGYNRRFSCST